MKILRHRQTDEIVWHNLYRWMNKDEYEEVEIEDWEDTLVLFNIEPTASSVRFWYMSQKYGRVPMYLSDVQLHLSTGGSIQVINDTFCIQKRGNQYTVNFTGQ